MQYTASTINRTALPRSKRMRALGAASVTPTVVNGESGDRYWNGEIDTETEETEVSTTYPVKVSKRLRIVDESGALHGDISIDANGRFVFDKGIISKEDIIAYGVGVSDIKSVTDVIEEYLAEHGVGGGGLSSVVITSSGSGNVVSGMSKTLSDDGKTLTLTLTKGISAYVKPSTGIPLADLASSVQTALGKADTALQEHQSLQGYATEQWVNGKGYLTAHQDISGKSNTTHTHSVKINGVTKTIAASGGAAVDLGTYLTSHQDISGKADKSSTVSTIVYDSTNKKITKTINGTTSDVVSVATLKSAMDAVTSTDLGNAIAGEVQARINAINALDVASAGGSGKYIQSISQTDGKISATAATLDKSAVGLGNVDNTSDANKPVSTATQTALNGKRDNTAPKSGAWFAGTPQIGSDGVMEIGRYIDFHPSSASTLNYGCRLDAGTSTTAHVLTLPNKTGTLAITSDNVASATKLQTARTLWGQSFDGSGNVSGAISNTGNITPSTTATSTIGSTSLYYSGVYANAYSADADELYITNTKSRKDIGFWINDGTGNTQRMLIRGSDGAVGIGSSSPLYKLHVAGGSVYSDTAIRVPNGKPFASKLANGTDIVLLYINANNKVNVGNSSYLTDVNGSTIQLYNSPTEKVIIGGGNISTEVEATTDRYVRVKNSNGEVRLHTSTNRGLYDVTLGKWIINTIKADSTVGINGGKVTIDNNGNLVANGDVTAYSDARLKSDIQDLEYRGSLSPKIYIKEGKKSIGFIAQEVRELYPELVLGEESDTKYLSLNYGAITAVLAAENKELRSRIDKLETLINKLIEK